MRKKLWVITLTALLTCVIVGCGSETTDEEFTLTFEKFESASEEEKTENTEETVEESQEDCTFADLSKRQFEFCSGAGGWSEEFTIEKDGYFTGKFHDSNMGDTGEGYEDGTCYSSTYSGHVTNLTKINDYTYQMTLEDISYDDTIGSEEIRQNVRYIYTDSYCLGGTDTFKIYLPGTPISELSEEICIWLSMANDSETELTMIAIVDETNEYGIYSLDRLEPLEDAQMTFNSYKESYDYYCGLISEAESTMEMLEYNIAAYELSDTCLNYIWNLIRYNVDEVKYDEILTEQRAWITEKEAAAEEESAEFGESFGRVIYYDTLAMRTMKRCEELIEYLK